MFEQRRARLDEQGKEARACEKRELGIPASLDAAVCRSASVLNLVPRLRLGKDVRRPMCGDGHGGSVGGVAAFLRRGRPGKSGHVRMQWPRGTRAAKSLCAFR